jgi:multiple sugar transport system ATP-binding protein
VKGGDQQMICVFRERITANPGETIHVRPDTRVVHLFEQETGKRLL